MRGKTAVFIRFRKYITLNYVLYEFVRRNGLRAASPKYQLDLEIAKKSSYSKLPQNKALRPLVTKILF